MKIKYILSLLLIISSPAFAKDEGQWENSDPEIVEWYRSLKRPDTDPPYTLSCCGTADAYWCDITFTKDGENFCQITDTRDDAPLRRVHVPVGTIIKIPNEKYTYRYADGSPVGNPTGHNIVFLSSSKDVYCFVRNTES